MSEDSETDADTEEYEEPPEHEETAEHVDADAAEPDADAAEPGEPIDPDAEELPLSALRERMEARRGDAEESPLSDLADERSADAEASDLFEEIDVGEVDGEVVWNAVVEGDAEATEVLGEEPGIGDPEPEPAVEPTETPDEHVINKREYCQRCEFFSQPPEATCGHEGTEIVEMTDSSHFRVRDCPKVAADDEALSGFASQE